MGIVEGIKDTARKTKDSITDSVENILNKPKSPQELASRLVEHLSHQEYTKMAKILTEEAKKYASKLGIEDLAPVNKQLDQFEDSMNDLAENLEKGDYQALVNKLKEIEKAIPQQAGKGADVFHAIKSFLNNIIKTIEEYIKEAKGDLDKKGPNYDGLKDTFEKSFNELTNK